MRGKGFTLVELLIVIAILAIMAVILVGIINPTALVNKGKDARRKKDLARIKVAFEEYYNDKGCYPNASKVAELNDKDVSCNSLIVFAPWLAPWPCDPDGDPYEIFVSGQNNTCFNEFRAYASLNFTQDRDIPDGWGDTASADRYTADPLVNYGVSSPNVSWYDKYEIPEMCLLDRACGGWCTGSCQIWDGTWGAGSCSGPNCYVGQDFSCQVDSCEERSFSCTPLPCP